MSKKITNRKVVLISATVMVVVLILGFTLALWSRNFTQTGTNTIASDCFDIQYSETDATGLVNAYPQTDEDGLKNVPYTVTIENTCDTAAAYDVLLNELSSNTLSESHVKVAVNDNYKMLNTYDAATPSSEVTNASSARKLTSGVVAGNETKSISIKSWMDAETSELEGSNKVFGYRITIEATATDAPVSTLASEILKTPITTTAINYSVLPVAGLYSASDNDGTSYFYRGNIDNNYVDLGLTYSQSFPLFVIRNDENGNENGWTYYAGAETECEEGYDHHGYASEAECIADIQDNSTNVVAPLLFRIMRINGDGTIRLIADNKIGSSQYNNTYSDYKYSGYTYDNSKVCTSSSPCDGTEGTSSTIKSYLDNWYTTNIASTSLNNKIATSIYCNDTTYTVNGEYRYYGSDTRLTAGMPSLVCPDTSLTYGGLYKLKVGLPSADEVMMAGYGLRESEDSPLISYIDKIDDFCTNSPMYFYDEPFVYVTSYYGQFDATYVGGNQWVHPVINLVSDVKVASGNGTQSNPYVIDLN